MKKRGTPDDEAEREKAAELLRQREEQLERVNFEKRCLERRIAEQKRLLEQQEEEARRERQLRDTKKGKH